ncbi:MAG: glycogen/starch/alpha-glucan phosphorylase [Chromatiales bacterium]|nr:glycogen/starch/alpha-glucan phosphorylase [Chromatiales bacterium]
MAAPTATPGRSAGPRSPIDVSFGGHTETVPRRAGAVPGALGSRAGWSRASPTTRPVPGYRVEHGQPAPPLEGGGRRVLRLSRPSTSGDYYGAVDEKVVSETITKVLYPNDEPAMGKQLRLAQQYFFVSCSLQDMIRIHLLRGNRLDTFARAVRGAAQRHPSRPSPWPS